MWGRHCFGYPMSNDFNSLARVKVMADVSSYISDMLASCKLFSCHLLACNACIKKRAQDRVKSWPQAVPVGKPQSRWHVSYKKEEAPGKPGQGRVLKS